MRKRENQSYIKREREKEKLEKIEQLRMGRVNDARSKERERERMKKKTEQVE